MKLFQRLLVAPAALGLMAPMAANADVTTISKDSDLQSEVIEARVDGVEAQVGDLMAGQFSSTTTMNGGAAFVVGRVDDETHTAAAGNLVDEKTFNYSYSLNLNSSFTGEDNLYTKIVSGNFEEDSTFADSTGGAALDVNEVTGNGLEIAKLWYTFPIGDSIQAWVGPRIENADMLASSPSIYVPVTKQFALGGNGSAYGSVTSPGMGAAWTQQVDDPSEARFAVSGNWTSRQGDQAATGRGLDGDDADQYILSKFEYGSPTWQISGAFAKKTSNSTTTHGFNGLFHSAAATATEGNETAYALRGYWKPDETGAVPEVQLGYDFSKLDEADANEAEDTKGWMIGLGWPDLFMDGNRGGVAYGSRQSATGYKDNTTTVDPAEDNRVWEAYYTFQVNDGVSVTPAIFGGSDVITDDNDISGALIQTEFRF